MDLQSIPKKTQLISLDSRSKTSGTIADSQFVFGSTSNIFLEDMKDVIGVRLLDYHVACLRGEGYDGAYVIDIQIDEIPTRGQILDSELTTVFARIPLDRSSNVAAPELFARDQYISRIYETPPRYSNPITLDRLTIHQTQLNGQSRARNTLQSDAGWYMVLEITTVDHEMVPLKDEIDDFEPLEEEPNRLYIGLGIFLIIGLLILIQSKR